MATPVPITGTDTGVDAAGSAGSQINWASLVPQILEKFIAVLEAALLIIGSIFLIRYVRYRLRKLETTYEQQRNAINLMEKITNGFIIVIAMTLALKIVGIDMTLLISVAILGLSYGLQDIIKNYVAGILILFKSPFQIGDIVKIREFTGKVSKMDFQSTSLETFDNRHITIYNSDVMTQSITNFSRVTQVMDPNASAKSSSRRVEFDVTVGYGSDTPKALKIFEKILNAHPKILKNPKYSVIFKKFADGGPTFSIKFWVLRTCNILKVRTDIATQIAQAFDDENIFTPYTKDLQVESEAALSEVAPVRKQRVQAFYQLPLFAEMQPVQQEVTLTPEQQANEVEGTSPENVDYDEPE